MLSSGAGGIAARAQIYMVAIQWCSRNTFVGQNWPPLNLPPPFALFDFIQHLNSSL